MWQEVGIHLDLSQSNILRTVGPTLFIPLQWLCLIHYLPPRGDLTFTSCRLTILGMTTFVLVNQEVFQAPHGILRWQGRLPRVHSAVPTFDTSFRYHLGGDGAGICWWSTIIMEEFSGLPVFRRALIPSLEAHSLVGRCLLQWEAWADSIRGKSSGLDSDLWRREAFGYIHSRLQYIVHRFCISVRYLPQISFMVCDSFPALRHSDAILPT